MQGGIEQNNSKNFLANFLSIQNKQKKLVCSNFKMFLLLILKTYEEELLDMNFEELLASLINLPYQFLVKDSEDLYEQYLIKLKEYEKNKDVDKNEVKQILISEFEF